MSESVPHSQRRAICRNPDRDVILAEECVHLLGRTCEKKLKPVVHEDSSAGDCGVSLCVMTQWTFFVLWTGIDANQLRILATAGTWMGYGSSSK